MIEDTLLGRTDDLPIVAKIGGIAGGSSNAISSITTPIAARRLTNNSTGGSVTATALQAGIG